MYQVEFLLGFPLFKLLLLKYDNAEFKVNPLSFSLCVKMNLNKFNDELLLKSLQALLI